MARVRPHNLRDLTGRVLGKLTVVQLSTERVGGRLTWECDCSCGTSGLLVSAHLLNAGKTRSCGCLRKELPHPTKRDLSGLRFGSLVATADTGERRGKGRAVVWECACDCGAVACVAAGLLTSGNTRSCGCLHRKVLADIGGSVIGKWTVLCVDDATSRKSAFLFYWRCRCECGAESPVRQNALLAGRSMMCRSCQFTASRENLTGRRFGRWVVWGVAPSPTEWSRKKTAWLCRCRCGTFRVHAGDVLRNGSSLSCGCWRSERSRIHGLSETRGYKNAKSKARRAAKLNRVPPWVDRDAIRQIYLKCPKGYAVDHVIPLQGDLVSGLHVPENLQYLSVADNSAKWKKFTPQFLERCTPQLLPNVYW